MCGIFGIIRRRSQVDAGLSKIIESALSLIGNRGPDSQGATEFNVGNYSYGLAHSRLSIVDLSDGGAQPMFDAASNLVLIFNGELYNHQEIRGELTSAGVVFTGSSDTEVLLKAWIRWGIDCLQKINGMFAFSILNQTTGETWLVRDRFGVKPLLWSYIGNRDIVFSSSVTAVAIHAGIEIDGEYCSRGVEYKVFECEESGSPFKSVYSIPSGGWIRIVQHDLNLKIDSGKWYEISSAVNRKRELLVGYADQDIVNECRNIFESSINLRLNCDVPLALSISSGLDSSAIAAFASTVHPDIAAFTYGHFKSAASEGPIVAKFALESNIKINYIWPDFTRNSLDDLLERTLSMQEAPFSGLSVMAQNQVFNEVKKQGFKVLLGGQGSDEIFAGYRKFFIVSLKEAVYQRDSKLTIFLLASLSMMLISELKQSKSYFSSVRRYTNQRYQFEALDLPPASQLNLWGSDYSLAARQIEDISNWSLPTLLRYEDRNSMGYGVETRLPFMDYRLVELALALPSRLKISNGYGKWILREITSSLLPSYVRLNRIKRGFDVTQNFIFDGLGDALYQRLQDSKVKLSPYLKRNVNLEKIFSNERLASNPHLLDEALMLAWLVNPIRKGF